MTNRIDGHLMTWPDVKKEYEWGAILIGNGASINVWPRFNYSSLYQAAQSTELEHRLSELDIGLFKEFHTNNFETIMSNLRVALRVNRSLGFPDREFHHRYQRIARALIGAVTGVHVKWPGRGILRQIKQALTEYPWVFTTNYDLLLYWAINLDGAEQFKDYFWGDGLSLYLKVRAGQTESSWVFEDRVEARSSCS